jgi:hypothetical protein
MPSTRGRAKAEASGDNAHEALVQFPLIVEDRLPILSIDQTRFGLSGEQDGTRASESNGRVRRSVVPHFRRRNFTT